MRNLRELIREIFINSGYHLAVIIIIICLVKAMEFAHPWFLSKIINLISESAYSEVRSLLGSYLILALTLSLLYPIQFTYLSWIIEKTRRILSERWSYKILRKDTGSLEKNDFSNIKIVEAFHRASSGVSSVSLTILYDYFPLIIQIFILSGYIIIMKGYWVLPLVLILSFVMIKVTNRIAKTLETVISKGHYWNDQSKTQLLGLCNSAPTIKLMGAHKTSLVGFTKSIRAFFRCETDYSFYEILSFAINDLFLVQLIEAFILLAGILLINSYFFGTSLAPGDVIGIYLYSSSLMIAIQQLTYIINTERDWAGAKESLDHILSAPERSYKLSNNSDHDKINPCILFQKFSLSLDEQESLEKINQRPRFLKCKHNIFIPFHHHVSILGSSGAGKTLLSEILGGLKNEPTIISIKGRDLSQWGIKELAKVCFYVEDKTHFLRGNIWTANFLVYAKNNVSKALTTMEGLDLHNFKPYLDDPLLEFPSQNLSEGERKRFGIFRAIMLSRPITIMDNPTGCLNPQLEEKIVSLLEKAFERKTLICTTSNFEFSKKFPVQLSLENSQLIQITEQRSHE